MDLSRVGANRREKHAQAFEGKAPEIGFDSHRNSIRLTIKDADGMGARGRYDYEVALSPDDLRDIIDFVSRNRSAYEDPKIRSALAESCQSILRLLISCAALPSKDISARTGR